MSVDEQVTGASMAAEDGISYCGEHRRLAPASRYAAVVVGNIVSGWVAFDSVLDLGCGNGAWLRGLADGGRRSVLGIEPEAQDPADLQIDAEHILQADLSRPLDLHRRFDLVLCLEVAEHIDAACADTVVANCVRHGDLVLFSAAIPGQGGLHHVNEQPPEYWAEKFAAHGFAVRDFIRPLIWNDQQIPAWYRQNLLVFLRQDAPHLAGLAARNAAVEAPLARAHPDLMAWLGRHAEALGREAEALQAEIDATTRALSEAQAAAARAEEAYRAADAARQQAASDAARAHAEATEAARAARDARRDAAGKNIEMARLTDQAQAEAARTGAALREAQQAAAAQVEKARAEARSLGERHAQEQEAHRRALAEYQAASRELSFAAHSIATLRREREIIFSSTIWRATAPLRRLGHTTPEGVRRTVRRALAGLLGDGPRIGAAKKPAAAAPAERAAPPAPSRAGPGGIVVVSGEPAIPGHHYRARRLAEAFATPGLAGRDVRCLALMEAAATPALLRAASLVIIWRAVACPETSAVIAAARAGNARLVYDIDDLMFVPELATAQMIDGIRTQNLDERETADYFRRVRSVIEQVDLCACATEELAHHVRGMRIPAFVLPNGFDAAELAAARLAVRRRIAGQSGDGLIRIGYAAGTRTHQRDFAVAAPALARILAAHSHCRLVLFREAGEATPLLDAAEFPELAAYAGQIEWRAKVDLPDLPAEMARFDINIAPLEVGNPFCEAKSELKFYEAALAGVVSIVSPTGPMRRIVRDRETGMLADSPDDWFEALSALIADPALRARMAGAALRDVLWARGPERRAELAQVLADQAAGGARGARAFELELRRARDLAPEFDIPEAETIFCADALGGAAVTVVVPLYNYAQYVTEALDSVAAQSLSPLDLIIVDDCSTDHSLEVAKAWAAAHAGRFNRLLVLRNRVNSGLARTRNTGFAAAETCAVLPLDADNRLRPGCLAALLAAMQRQGAAFAYPKLQCFGDQAHLISDLPFSPARFVAGNYIDAMALVAKAAWAAVGGYAHIRLGWEDYDFWCRLVGRGMFGVHVPKVLAEYRFHQASMLRTTTDVDGNKGRVVAQLEQRHPWLAIQDRV